MPPFFHQLWIPPEGRALPDDVKQNMTAWRTLDRKFTQRLWSLSEVTRICHVDKMPRAARAIAACRFPSMQADIARLVLLLVYGGFWIDLKLSPLRPFLAELAHHDLVLTEHFTKPDLPDPTGHLSNSFLGALPGHPVVAQALEAVIGNIERRQGGSIYQVTGAPNLMVAYQALQPERTRLLAHHEAWDLLFKIKGGSYNGAAGHWSIREKTESPYI